jgi:hypothetical protein
MTRVTLHAEAVATGSRGTVASPLLDDGTMPMRALLLFVMFLCAATAHAQTGPWAKYDAMFKGDVLLR